MTTHHTTESVERLAWVEDAADILDAHAQSLGWKRHIYSDHLRDLAAERDHLLAAQSYTYIGKDGKPVLARDLEDERDALRARLEEAGEILAWYRDNGSWVNNFGPEGTEARDNLAKDAGRRADAFLNGGGNG